MRRKRLRIVARPKPVVRVRARVLAIWVLGLGAAYLLALAATPARAAVYYIRSDGSDSNTGTANSASSAWQTLSKANSTLQPGDAVQVVSLTAGDTATGVIQPANAATAVPAARIAYVGPVAKPPVSSGLSGHGLATLTLTASNVTVKGFRFRGDVSIRGARYDSVAACIASSLRLLGAGQSVAAYNQVNGELLLREYGLSAPACEADTVRGNVVTVASLGTGNAPSGYAFAALDFTRGCLIDSNQVTATFPNTGTSVGIVCGRLLQNATNLTLSDNKWALSAGTAGSGDTWRAARLEDSSAWNLIQRDTLSAGTKTDNEIGVYLAHPGLYGASHHNRYAGCRYKANGSIYHFATDEGDSLRGSSFASLNRAGLRLADPRGLVIDHCTIAGLARVAAGTADMSALWIDTLTAASLRISNTILYTDSLVLKSGGADSSVWVSPVVRTPSDWRYVRSDRNVYWSRRATTDKTYRALSNGVGWSSGVGPTSVSCQPGFGMNECASTWGDPALKDTSYAGFDPGIATGAKASGLSSAALGPRFGLSSCDRTPYAGAAQPTDTIPPDSVAFTATASYRTSNLTGAIGYLLTLTIPGGDHSICEPASITIKLRPWANGAYASLAAFDAATGDDRYCLNRLPPHGSRLTGYVEGINDPTGNWIAVVVADAAGNRVMAQQLNTTYPDIAPSQALLAPDGCP